MNCSEMKLYKNLIRVLLSGRFGIEGLYTDFFKKDYYVEVYHKSRRMSSAYK